MKTPIGKLQRLALMAGIAAGGIGTSGAILPVNATVFGSPTGLKFNLTSADVGLQAALDGTSTDTAKISAANGFIRAATRWSNLLTDNVTVNLSIGFSSLGGNTLGVASTNLYAFNYSDVRSWLAADISSGDDNTAVGSLTTNSTFNRLINKTLENGPGGADTYVDAVNSGSGNNIFVSVANARALLGNLVPSSQSDASINFSSDYAWDYDRTNGIGSGLFDFEGVAVHEIGHALGFLSGVDSLDESNGSQSKTTFKATTLDLFRYSTASKGANAIDFTTGDSDKFFSIDGGNSFIKKFSNGVNSSDGLQAGHWKDNLGIGIMDPTFARGEIGIVSQNDLQALDVIGWNLSGASEVTAVPEPSTWIGTFICAAFGTKLVIKRRKKLAELERDANKDEV